MSDCGCGHSVLLHSYGFGRCFICAWEHIVISGSLYDECSEYAPPPNPAPPVTDTEAGRDA